MSGNDGFRVLQDPQEILQARKLLYKVYIEDFKWKFKPDNPSGIHVQQLANGEKMLCDHFDDQAVWIGTFKGKELAGVSRTLTRENKFGKLDVELYKSSNKKFSTAIKMNEPCTEIQRVAVLKQYKEESSSFIDEILSFNLNFAKTRGSNIVAATSSKDGQRSLEKFGFECLDENFFYGEENELPVSVYCLSFHMIEKAIQKMKGLGIHN